MDGLGHRSVALHWAAGALHQDHGHLRAAFAGVRRQEEAVLGAGEGRFGGFGGVGPGVVGWETVWPVGLELVGGKFGPQKGGGGDQNEGGGVTQNVCFVSGAGLFLVGFCGQHQHHQPDLAQESPIGSDWELLGAGLS